MRNLSLDQMMVLGLVIIMVVVFFGAVVIVGIDADATTQQMKACVEAGMVWSGDACERG